MSFSDTPMFQRTRIATTFLRIFLLSVLWLLFCLPVLTAAPASMAAYHTAVKVIRRDRNKLFPEYFRSFRNNFKSGFVLGCVLLLLTTLLILGTRVASVMAHSSHIWSILSYVYFLLLLLLGVFSMFIIPFFSRFEVSLKQGLHLSIVSVFKHLFTAITAFLVWVLGYHVVRFLPAMILLIPGCCFAVCSHIVEPILKQHTATADSAQDTWFLE